MSISMDIHIASVEKRQVTDLGKDYGFAQHFIITDKHGTVLDICMYAPEPKTFEAVLVKLGDEK